MKKRKIYRYTGKDILRNFFADGHGEIRPGQFISKRVFDALDKGVTIEQEMRPREKAA